MRARHPAIVGGGNAGTAGEFSVGNAPDDRCGDTEEVLAAAAT
jgi:hypothetical protein